MELPEIVVKHDYNGYFENLVKGWCKKKTTPFKHTKININAGPYRADAVSAFDEEDGSLTLDFYSAIRNGFGSLSQTEIQEIMDDWL